MEDFTVKKSTCEKYTIRWGSYGWAVFTIDDAGLFNCQSDYGDYSHMWPHHGRESFKHFLIEIARDTSYLLKKVASRDTFDYDKAVENWKKVIIQWRKDDDCTKEMARAAWNAIGRMEEYSGSVQLVQKELYESKAINDICEEPWYYFETDLDYSAQALAFAHEVMPMFANILTKEIESVGKAG